MNKYVERLYNGIWKENPIFVQMLGLCPTLAVTTSAINGVGMGLSSTAVLVCANLLISALRHLIPDRVRLPGEDRSRSITRNDRRYVDGRFPSVPVQRSWYLHPADRCKLYHPWSC